jgi:O-antigen/teichoic acid export membrane protein
MARSHADAWFGTVAANVLILLCGLATGILAARLLAPEGRGALATVLFWPSLLTSVGLLSLPAALVYRRGTPGVHRPVIASTAICLCLAIALVCVALGYAILPAAVSESNLLALTRIYLLAFVPFTFLALTLLAIDQSDLRFHRYNVFRLIPSGVYLIGLLALWGTGAISVEAAVWATWMGTFLTAVIRLYFARDELRARPSMTEARALAVNAMRFHGGTIFSLLLSQADRLAVIVFWDARTVGFYVVAFTFASAGLGAISMAFRDLLFPRLSAIRNAEEQKRLMGQTLRYATLLLIPCAGFVAVLSPWLLPLLFGKAFAGAIGLCLLLVLAYLPAALRDIVSNGLRGMGEWRACIFGEAIALGMFALAVWPLASFYGVLGVPIALLIANCISILYLFVLLRHRFELHARDVWGLQPSTFREVVDHGIRRLKDFRGAKAGR